MKLGSYLKQPAERKDYDIDFSEWMPTGDTISTYSGLVECVSTPGNDSLFITSQSATGVVVKTWLADGTDNEVYKVTVTITTVGGRIQQDEFIIRVRDV